MTTQSSLTQAAIVLKSLPKRQAAKILSRLEAADVRTVMDAVSELDHVSAEEISEALDKLKRAAKRWKTGSNFAYDDLETLTAEIGSVYQETEPQPEPQPEPQLKPVVSNDHPFGFLVDALPMVRDKLMRDEHPKNLAMILASLPPEKSSELVQSMETETRFSVLKRLCDLDEVHEDELTQLSYALKLRYHKLMGATKRSQTSEGVSSAAELLSCTDKDTQETLLAYMNQTDPDLADELHQSVVELEDFLGLSSSDIVVLLRNVDTSCWAPALKGASLELKKVILANMAAKPAELLNHEMASIGHVDQQVCNLASKQIINAAVQLNREGKIRLNKFRSSQKAKPPKSANPVVYSVNSSAEVSFPIS